MCSLPVAIRWARGRWARSCTVSKYSLQAKAKMKEGKEHPDRDGQFRYINDEVRRFLAAGDPVISIDTRKE